MHLTVEEPRLSPEPMFSIERNPLRPLGTGRCHVVPVHGTWGAGFWHSIRWNFLPPNRRQRVTQWKICDQLQEAGAIIHPTFTWSGKNSHPSRMEAGKELADYIAGLKLDPSDRLFLVAHSHGGNVALYALRCPGTEGVKGIIFLATPFLQFGPQDFPFQGFRLLPFAIRNFVTVVLGSVLLSLAVMLGKPVLSQLSETTLWVSVGIVVAISIGIGYVFGFIAERAISKMFPETDAALTEATTTCAYYQPQAPRRLRVLILRKVGDEASAALESGRFVEWATTWAWQLLSWLTAKPPATLAAFKTFVERHAWARWIPIPLTIIGITLFLGAPENFGALVAILYMVGTFLFGGVVCAVLALFIVQSFLLTLILLLNVIRFGLGPALGQAALIRVTSEATPLGSWEVETFPATGFGHSEIHEDLHVAEVIANWLHTDCCQERRETGA